jgi:hypothetical protein
MEFLRWPCLNAIGLVALVGLFACSGTVVPLPTPEPPKSTIAIQATTQSAVIRSVGSQSPPTAKADKGISSTEADLLSPIADWHQLWGDPSNSPLDQKDLLIELDELITAIDTRLSEPLISMVSAYEAAHYLVADIKEHTAYRSAVFAAGADVLAAMDSPCDLPDASSVPEASKKELDLLKINCV